MQITTGTQLFTCDVSVCVRLRPTDLWGKSQIKRGAKSGTDWSELGWSVQAEMGKCDKASPIIHRKSEKQTIWCDRELSHRHRKVVSPKITDLIPSCQKNKNWPNYSTFCTYPAKSNTAVTHLSPSYPLPSFINWVQRLSPDMWPQTVWSDTQHGSDV